MKKKIKGSVYIPFNTLDINNDIILPTAIGGKVKDSIVDESGVTVIKEFELDSVNVVGHSILLKDYVSKLERNKMKKEKSYLILAIIFMTIGLVMIGFSEVVDANLTYYEIASIFMFASWIFVFQYRYFRWKRRNLESEGL